MITLEDVRVAVPPLRQGDTEKVLLDDVTLELTQHRIAVVGANGSGKSTLLRLLNGLREPSRGTVRVHGHDTRTDGKKVRALVGFIFTDPLMQLLMSTPVEDIELSLRSLVRGRAERTRRAMELLEQRGIGSVAHQSIYDLSGGERQLVALTSVLAVEPHIIVADEPTTLLDLRNRALVAETFAGLSQQLVVVTHDLDLVSDFDRVLVVDGGRVVIDDSPGPALDGYRRIALGR